MEVALVVANLGSPDSPSQKDVAKFLKEFLCDPYVVSLPSPLRTLLVHCIIAPLRSPRSALAYQSIWGEKGGPLRRNTVEVAQCLEQKLGIPTAPGMRYGDPSIAEAINKLSAEHIVLLPLYPHHADSTRTTMTEQTANFVQHRKLSVVPPFYNRTRYIDILARHTQAELHDDIEHLLISFHGLPIRHITKADPTGSHCLATPSCCETDSVAHATCYMHQCKWTATALAEKLGLPYTLTFQSRLGLQKWLEPATTAEITRCASAGMKKIAVVCPSFTVDNLETLEEIGIQARELFESLGGEKLQLISSLNTNPDWIQFLADLVAEQIDEPIVSDDPAT